MNFYLPISIEFGPRIIRQLLRQIPAEQLDTALQPERFTPREVVAHLADWEPIMRERIRTALTAPGAVIQPYDEGQMAVDHRYATLDPWEQLEVFTRERAETAAFIRTLKEEDWSQTAHHPERGPQSVDDLANLLLGHDLYHIEQLAEYLP